VAFHGQPFFGPFAPSRTWREDNASGFSHDSAAPNMGGRQKAQKAQEFTSRERRKGVDPGKIRSIPAMRPLRPWREASNFWLARQAEGAEGE